MNTERSDSSDATDLVSANGGEELMSQNDVEIDDYEVDINLNEDESSRQPITVPKQRPRIHVFSGNEKDITIENWIKMFETVSKSYQWPKKEMIDALCEYLKGEALNFFIEIRDGKSWEKIKSTLLSRFGVQAVDPIVEFDRLKFSHTNDAHDYFLKKRRLAGLASLTEAQAVCLMIEHLSDDLRKCFIGHRVVTYGKFWAIVKTAETALMTRNSGSDKSLLVRDNKPIKRKFEQNHKSSKKTPKGACWGCERAGKPNQMHWSNECPLKKNSNASKQVNYIQQNLHETTPTSPSSSKRESNCLN